MDRRREKQTKEDERASMGEWMEKGKEEAGGKEERHEERVKGQWTVRGEEGRKEGGRGRHACRRGKKRERP